MPGFRFNEFISIKPVQTKLMTLRSLLFIKTVIKYVAQSLVESQFTFHVLCKSKLLPVSEMLLISLSLIPAAQFKLHPQKIAFLIVLI